MERVVKVGDMSVRLTQSTDGRGIFLTVLGNDSAGMWGCETIRLQGEQCVEFFEALCEVMPGTVQ